MKKNFLSNKRIICGLLCLILMLTSIPVFAQTPSDDIVILYTNDVHTYIDNPLSYDVIAAVKADLEKEYKH